LYLGFDWASDSLFALGIAFVWLNLLMIGYRRQRPRPVRGPPIAAALAGCIAVAALLALMRGTPRDYPVATPQAGTRGELVAIDWRHRGYRELPQRIDTLRGQTGAPL